MSLPRPWGELKALLVSLISCSWPQLQHSQRKSNMAISRSVWFSILETNLSLVLDQPTAPRQTMLYSTLTFNKAQVSHNPPNTLMLSVLTFWKQILLLFHIFPLLSLCIYKYVLTIHAPENPSNYFYLLFVWSCLCAHVCALCECKRSASRVNPQMPVTVVFETGTPMEPESLAVRLSWLACKPQGPAYPCFPSVGRSVH